MQMNLRMIARMQIQGRPSSDDDSASWDCDAGPGSAGWESEK